MEVSKNSSTTKITRKPRMDTPVKADGENTAQNIIKLNVGGQIFQTTPTTLKQSDFLTRMLNGSIPSLKDESGAYFIDRDPKYFEVILSFMRTFKWDIPPSISSKNKVLQEAEFYMLRTTKEIGDDEKQTNPPSGLYTFNKDDYFFIYKGFGISSNLILSAKEAVVVSKNVVTIKSKSAYWLGLFINDNQNFIMNGSDKKPLKVNWSRRPKKPIKETIKRAHLPSITIQADHLVKFFQKEVLIGESDYEVDPKTNFVCAAHESPGLKIEVYFFGDRYVVDINGEWKYCKGE